MKSPAKQPASRQFAAVLLACAFAVASGCSSSPKETVAQKTASAASSARGTAGANATPNAALPSGWRPSYNPASLHDLSMTSECDLAMIRNAPAPFHLSFKKSTTQQNFGWEADVTSAGVEGTATVNGQTNPIHALRAEDPHSVDMQATMLVMPMMFQELNMAKDGAATLPVGQESVNGYDTIKYTVDTTKLTAMDKAGWTAGMNAKDYNITATAWITRDTGCMVKFNGDFEVDNKDGSVDKTHYEGDITRKQ